MVDFLVKVVVAYLLGSVSGSLVVGRLRGGVDIRTQGSGNAGGTNALRTQGRVFAFWVMLIDVGKGLLAVTVVTHLSLPGPLPSGPQWQAWLPVACGAAAVVGHVFPVWFGFRGGKGAATLLGIVAVLSPWGLVPVLAVWILCLVLTGYVGLSTIFGAAAFPVFVLISGAQPFAPLLIFGVVMALFIVFTHRSNLRRMFAGTESRFRKVMFLRKS